MHNHLDGTNSAHFSYQFSLDIPKTPQCCQNVLTNPQDWLIYRTFFNNSLHCLLIAIKFDLHLWCRVLANLRFDWFITVQSVKSNVLKLYIRLLKADKGTIHHHHCSNKLLLDKPLLCPQAMLPPVSPVCNIAQSNIVIYSTKTPPPQHLPTTSPPMTTLFYSLTSHLVM